MAKARMNHCVDGQEVYVCGYAATFFRDSKPCPDHDGRSIVLLENCFDHALLDSSIEQCTFNFEHDGQFAYARVRDGNLQIAIDRLGLKFQAGPFPVSRRNDAGWLLSAIAKGEVRAASYAPSEEIAQETFDGWRTIKKIPKLLDVACCHEGAFDHPAVWLSTEHPRDLPGHLGMLARAYESTPRQPMTGRQKLEQMQAVCSQLGLADSRRSTGAQSRQFSPARVSATPHLGNSMVGGKGGARSPSGNRAPLSDNELSYWRSIEAEHVQEIQTKQFQSQVPTRGGPPGDGYVYTQAEVANYPFMIHEAKRLAQYPLRGRQGCR